MIPTPRVRVFSRLQTYSCSPLPARLAGVSFFYLYDQALDEPSPWRAKLC